MPQRTVLVTGGAGGLGRSVVADARRRRLARRGAGRGRIRSRRRPTASAPSSPTSPTPTTSPAPSAPRPDLKALVNLVGGFAADQPVKDTPIAEFEKLFRLNLRPTYLVTQAALPRLEGGGVDRVRRLLRRTEPFAGGAGYAASKAAVIAFAKAVAEEGQAGRHPLQRDRADPDRHAGQPRGDARVRAPQARPAGADREGGRVPVLGRLGGDHRPGDRRLVSPRRT